MTRRAALVVLGVLTAALLLLGPAAGPARADVGAPPADPGGDWVLASAEVVADTEGARGCDPAQRWTWTGPEGSMSLLTVVCDLRGSADGMVAWLGLPGTVVPDASEFGERVSVDASDLVRSWAAPADDEVEVAMLRTPCAGADTASGGRGDACAAAALPFALAVARTMPGGVEDARLPGYHPGQIIITVAVPFVIVAIFVAPLRVAVFLARPRYRSGSASPRYHDTSRAVMGARWRRRIRRLLAAVLAFFAFVTAPVIASQQSSSTLLGLAVIGGPIALLLLVGYLTFLRPHRVERGRRGVVGGGAEAAVGTSLSVLAAGLVLPLLALATLGAMYAEMRDGWPAVDAAALARLDLPLLAPLLPLATALRDDSIIVMLLTFPVLAVLAAVDAFGQRLRNASVEEALAQDTRPHYLYLRSFDEDRLRLPALLRRRGLVSALSLFRRVRFEEVLVRRLSETGPVIAIAPPGSRLPTIGAARASFANDEWQQHVARYAATARAVVLSATPDQVRAGFGWELDLVANRIPHRRVMVVLGPWSRTELRRRWRSFCEAVAHVPLFAPMTMPWVPEGVHVLAHSDRQGWQAWGATRRLDWTYAVSVEEATRAYLPDWS